jgi:hypothetical protein
MKKEKERSSYDTDVAQRPSYLTRRNFSHVSAITAAGPAVRRLLPGQEKTADHKPKPIPPQKNRLSPLQIFGDSVRRPKPKVSSVVEMPAAGL